jgi:hypothetical protein
VLSLVAAFDALLQVSAILGGKRLAPQRTASERSSLVGIISQNLLRTLLFSGFSCTETGRLLVLYLCGESVLPLLALSLTYREHFNH